MKIVIQRVKKASVEFEGKINSIQEGICVLLGIREDDFSADANYIVSKILNTRIFDSEDGKLWGASVLQRNFEILIVSEFTLYGFMKGNKPDFHYAMKNNPSRRMYESIISELEEQMPGKVESGFFGEEMLVEIENDGPCTLVIESRDEIKAPEKIEELSKIGGQKALKEMEKERDMWVE